MASELPDEIETPAGNWVCPGKLPVVADLVLPWSEDEQVHSEMYRLLRLYDAGYARGYFDAIVGDPQMQQLEAALDQTGDQR